jgi:hypothetical protein
MGIASTVTIHAWGLLVVLQSSARVASLSLCPGSKRECYNGLCLADGTCKCQSGWQGLSCSLKCPGIPTSPCFGNGVCNIKGICICKWGYAGAACEKRCPLYFGSPCGCSAPNDISCRGNCTADGTCICGTKYRGPDCSISCARCVNGDCTEDGSCACHAGWTSPLCSVACPPPPAAGVPPCSGRGVCVFLGGNTSACVCARGLEGLVERYEGDDCEVAVANAASRLNQTAEVPNFARHRCPALRVISAPKPPPPAQ